MRSREVICYACNQKFRENLVCDEDFLIRAKNGRQIEADTAQCPMCRRLMYITHESLTGLDINQYEEVEGLHLR